MLTLHRIHGARVDCAASGGLPGVGGQQLAAPVFSFGCRWVAHEVSDMVMRINVPQSVAFWGYACCSTF